MRVRGTTVAAALSLAALLAGCGGGGTQPERPSGPIDFASSFDTYEPTRNGVSGGAPWDQLNAREESQFARATDHVRLGQGSGRFTVRSGDQFHAPDSGERANLVWYGSDELPGQTHWYGFSMRLPDDFRTTPANGRGQRWTIAFQVHAADKPEPLIEPDPGLFGVRPPIALSINDDGYSIDVSGGVITTQDGEGIERQDGQRLADPEAGDDPLRRGEWQDLMIGVHYAVDDTGSVEVWRRWEGESAWSRVAEVRGPNTYAYRPAEGQPGAGRREEYDMPDYLVIGLYRNAYGRPDGPGERTPEESYTAPDDLTQTLWYDSFVRGDSRAVVQRYLETGELP